MEHNKEILDYYIFVKYNKIEISSRCIPPCYNNNNNIFIFLILFFFFKFVTIWQRDHNIFYSNIKEIMFSRFLTVPEQQTNETPEEFLNFIKNIYVYTYISSNLSVTINNFHERNQQFCFHTFFLCSFYKYFFREIIIFYLLDFFYSFFFISFFKNMLIN